MACDPSTDGSVAPKQELKSAWEYLNHMQVCEYDMCCAMQGTVLLDMSMQPICLALTLSCSCRGYARMRHDWIVLQKAASDQSQNPFVIW